MQTGPLRVGSKVVVVPGGEAGTVKAIEMDGLVSVLVGEGWGGEG